MSYPTTRNIVSKYPLQDTLVLLSASLGRSSYPITLELILEDEYTEAMSFDQDRDNEFRLT